MKALKHSPEWNPMPDKADKHAIARNKKAALLPVPYSHMTDLQIHARGTLVEGGRVDYHTGKGAETLFINAGYVRNANEVMHKAQMAYSNFITNKPKPMGSETK